MEKNLKPLIAFGRAIFAFIFAFMLLSAPVLAESSPVPDKNLLSNFPLPAGSPSPFDNLSQYAEKWDIMNDSSRPDITGRIRRVKPEFEIYGNRKNKILEKRDSIPLYDSTSGFDSRMRLMESASGNVPEAPAKSGEIREDSIWRSRWRPWFPPDDRKKKKDAQSLILKDLDGPQRVEIRADEIRYSHGEAVAVGNVSVISKGVTINAQELVYNQYSRDISARGDVSILKGESIVKGSTLSYNALTQSARIENAVGQADDMAVGDVKLQEKLFFWGDLVEWKPDELRILKGIVTSCDVPPPDYHFHITGDEILIYPQDKMIVRNARFFKGKSQMLGVKSMVLPLRQRDPRARQSFIPQIGRNSLEGEYVKEAVGYLWGKKDYGIVHLDWYRKIGIGAGIEHYYSLGDRGAGKFYYYGMGSSKSDTNRYNLSNRLYYKFPGNYFMSMNYTAERYEFPEYSSPNIKNTDFYFSHFTDRSRSALQVYDYGFGEKRNYGVNFLSGYAFSDRIRSQMVLDYLSSETSIKRMYRLNTLGRLVHSGDIFETSLTYDYTWGDKQFYVNRVPELAINSRDISTGPLDWRASVSAGSFKEMPSGITTTRSDLRLSLLNRVYRFGDSTAFTVAGGARQLIYGTGEKKYIAKSNANLVQNLGNNFSLIASHYYQDRNGVSPFQMDYYDRYNIIGGTVEFNNRKNFIAQVTGGYDMNHKQYQSMIPQVEYWPSKDWKFVFTSIYDVHNRTWMNMDGEVGFKIGRNLGVKYWGIYDMVNKRMTYQNYVLELDSHDFSTRLIYKGSQGELWLSLAMKAFPYEKVDVGPDENRNIIEKGLLDRAPDGENL